MGSAGCSGRPGAGPSAARTPRGEGPAGRRSGRQRLDPSVDPDPRAPRTPAREPRVSEAGAQRGCARTCGAELSEEGNRALGQGTATHLPPRLSRGGGAGTARKSVKGCAAGGSGEATLGSRPRPPGTAARVRAPRVPRRARRPAPGRVPLLAAGPWGAERHGSVRPRRSGRRERHGPPRCCQAPSRRDGESLRAWVVWSRAPTHSSWRNESFFLLKREK